MGPISPPEKNAKSAIPRWRAFVDHHIFIFITNDDEQTAYHEISERFKTRFRPFNEDRLLDELERMWSPQVDHS